jgi:CRP/FNR family transcriptional regulator, cyclic AMP receptor protein
MQLPLMDGTAARARRNGEPGSVRVLDRDPDLARDLGDVEFERAAAACRARTLCAQAGVLRGWPLRSDPELGFQGLLVLRGVLSRRVAIDHLHVAELLGPGDLLRPWTGAEGPFMPVCAKWRVHVDVECAVLDRRFHQAAAPWPELASALLDRADIRAHALVRQLLIAQTARMTERIELLMWHLASRWGRMRPDGVFLPLVLSRALIAELACTTRESASRALSALATSGVVQTAEGGFLLRNRAGALDESAAEAHDLHCVAATA